MLLEDRLKEEEDLLETANSNPSKSSSSSKDILLNLVLGVPFFLLAFCNCLLRSDVLQQQEQQHFRIQKNNPSNTHKADAPKIAPGIKPGSSMISSKLFVPLPLIVGLLLIMSLPPLPLFPFPAFPP